MMTPMFFSDRDSATQKVPIRKFQKWIRRETAALKNIYTTAEVSDVVSYRQLLLQQLSDCLSQADTFKRTTDFWPPVSTLHPTNTPFPAGEHILLVGTIGNAGTYFLNSCYSRILKERFPGWFLREAAMFLSCLNFPDKLSMESLSRLPVSAIYPVTEGGLHRTLYEFGTEYSVGYQINYRSVPVSQITIELCEYFDLDPWQLLSCGCLLLVTPQGSALQKQLQEQLEIPCQIIGYTTQDSDKLILHPDNNSRINPPQPDGLLQLFQKTPPLF